MVQKKAEGMRSRAKTRTRARSGDKAEVSEKPHARRNRKAGDAKSTATSQEGSRRASGKRAVRTRRRVKVSAAPPPGIGPQIGTILRELRQVKAMVEPFPPPTRSTDANAADPMLEGAVDSLRRLLSEVIEGRMEEVVRDLVDVRREMTSALSDAGGPALDRLDRILGSLGAVKFEARQHDAMDPLIHVAVEERYEDGVPEGVVLTTVRPGFRTGRGLVVCKAAVAVSRRA